MRIREAELCDAAALLVLERTVEDGTPHLLDEAAELGLDVPAMTRRLGQFLSRPNWTVLVAEDEAGLQGYLFAVGGHLRGIAHAARINGLGVAEAARRKGVGLGLLRRLDAWAEGSGVRRLELKFMAPNAAARALYTRAGYLEEGVQRGAYLVDGRLVDAVLMGKLVSGPDEEGA
ncbi:GCN5-related N-acetyltransferase [Alkalidesulfovibrio alkalitolerans DSM 16529]|uniref:GCN5-related N-acetyltransferase n=1 Tax=Alkalidesulfovibrio alkalitolerans DSM 16529 TaxID=1121439 RepID=S7TG24_9BACT|nr:GNAT family N-acetyltransferase [Alkalidesulfovibrio alkalitolerans]EPR36167.1 GCN5-related N-acetyltransferase [Alkalidesulfovibrio alkalitolerans DSM 16529]